MLITLIAACQFHWHEIRRRRKSEGEKVRDYEKQIDQLACLPKPRRRQVYLSTIALLCPLVALGEGGASADKLYGLTPEEIKIVEANK